jgi:hypothetical protein
VSEDEPEEDKPEEDDDVPDDVEGYPTKILVQNKN